MRNGTVLVRTKNATQEAKLIKLCAFSNEIEIKVTDYNSLNHVFSYFSYIFLGLRETKPKLYIDGISKILKRNNKNALSETGLIIISPSMDVRPIEIKLVYENIMLD